MDEEYIIKQQIKRIKRYVRIMSKRRHHDIGVTGCLEWVEKYAKDFRKLTEKISEKCIHCGACDIPIEPCPDPLNPKRIRSLRILLKNKKDVDLF